MYWPTFPEVDEDELDEFEVEMVFDPYSGHCTIIPAKKKSDTSITIKAKDLKDMRVDSPDLPQNNDGRDTCYACGAPTRKLDTGMSGDMRICTKCKK